MCVCVGVYLVNSGSIRMTSQIQPLGQTFYVPEHGELSAVLAEIAFYMFHVMQATLDFVTFLVAAICSCVTSGCESSLLRCSLHSGASAFVSHDSF